MTKRELQEYRSIVGWIDELRENINSSVLSDVVSGSALEHPYTKRTFRVSGLDYLDENTQKLNSLRKLKRRKSKIERFVNSIEDSFTRQIFYLKYIQGEEKVSWWEVADKIGGNNTADSVRKAAVRYLKKRKPTSG